jgi:peptidoglycan/LPS O-acetylase OafA/YrhL
VSADTSAGPAVSLLDPVAAPPAAPPKARLGQLDGIRGIAVGTVFAYHVGLGWAKGGLLGVDIFFVLSGFLITGLLLRENAKAGTIAFGRFWGRRAIRLLPAMLVMLFVVMLVWRLTAPAAVLPAVRADVISALLYVANWHFAFAGSDYFSHGLSPSPMLHMWSLAVEEQFYLLWPLIFWAATRKRTAAGATRAIRAVSAFGLVASTGLMALLSFHGVSASRLYYGTDTRASALLAGALLATFLPLNAPVPRGPRAERIARRRSTTLGALGTVALIALLYLTYAAHGQSDWLYRGGFLLVAVLAAAIIAGAVGAPAGPLAVGLRFPPLRALGRISYGVYLWHWPVILFLTHARTGMTGNSLLALRIATTITLAALSWTLVEQPLQRAFKPGAARRAGRADNPARIEGVAGTAGTPRLRNHKPAWIGVTTLAAILALAAVTAASPTPAVSAGADISPIGLKIGSSLNLPSPSPAQRNPIDAAPLRVNVYGDSLAYLLLKFMNDNNFQKTYNLQLGGAPMIGCGVLGDASLRFQGIIGYPDPNNLACNGWATKWANNVAASRPQVSVILVGRWEMVDRVWDGAMHNILDGSGFADFVMNQLKRGISIAAGGGAKVALVDMPCVQETEAPDGSTYPESDPRRVAKFNELLARAAQESTATTKLFSMDPVLCENGKVRARDANGAVLRGADGVHPTEAGAVDAGKLIIPEIQSWYRSVDPGAASDPATGSPTTGSPTGPAATSAVPSR